MQILVRSFKELGEFVGRKFEDLTTKIANIPTYDDSRSVAAIHELAAQIENFHTIISTTPPDLTPVTEAITALSSQFVPPPAPESLLPQLKTIADAIQAIDVQPIIQPVDLKPLTKAIKSLESKVQQPEPVDLSPVTEAIRALSKKLDKPSTIRLDEMQLRALSNSGGGTNGGQLAARKITVKNLALTATDTQYSYTFPANTVAWTIKLRDQGTLGYYSFSTGTLPLAGGGGDGSLYITLPQNYLHSQDGVDWSGKIIYMGAESASQVAEIISYQL
jgi:hypothetical protein